MKIVDTFADARAESQGIVGCVPTMGFLHEGHLSLISAAREHVDTVVVTSFVNPLQFGEGEDLASYPRDQSHDVMLAEDAGADVLFAPPLEEMYPIQPATTVDVGGLAEPLEGSHRPGHFRGVAIVVAKLLGGLRPDSAYFGRKDAQQLAVVRRMVLDLSLPVTVIGCPTVREHDGLALSSRNVLLGPEDRRLALSLVTALETARDAMSEGERDGSALEALVAAKASGLHLDYASLVDASDVTPLATLDREAFLAVAAKIGRTRLIDNLYVEVSPGGEAIPDLGRRLAGPSVLYGRR